MKKNYNVIIESLQPIVRGLVFGHDPNAKSLQLIENCKYLRETTVVIQVTYYLCTYNFEGPAKSKLHTGLRIVCDENTKEKCFHHYGVL